MDRESVYPEDCSPFCSQISGHSGPCRPLAQYNPVHSHEPQIPVVLDEEGRCLICGMRVRIEDLERQNERVRQALADHERDRESLERIESKVDRLWEALVKWS